MNGNGLFKIGGFPGGRGDIENGYFDIIFKMFYYGVPARIFWNRVGKQVSLSIKSTVAGILGDPISSAGMYNTMSFDLPTKLIPSTLTQCFVTQLIYGNIYNNGVASKGLLRIEVHALDNNETFVDEKADTVYKRGKVFIRPPLADNWSGTGACGWESAETMTITYLLN